MTPPEIALWLALRRNDARLRFRKQHPAGPDYVLDFYGAPAGLVIEVDGEIHSRGDQPERDARRDAWLASQRLLVLRYPAVDVLSNTDGVVAQIIAVAVKRMEANRSIPRPPPPGGGGSRRLTEGEVDTIAS